jgi:hypothetical protein
MPNRCHGILETENKNVPRMQNVNQNPTITPMPQGVSKRRRALQKASKGISSPRIEHSVQQIIFVLSAATAPPHSRVSMNVSLG